MKIRLPQEVQFPGEIHNPFFRIEHSVFDIWSRSVVQHVLFAADALAQLERPKSFKISSVTQGNESRLESQTSF